MSWYGPQECNCNCIEPSSSSSSSSSSSNPSSSSSSNPSSSNPSSSSSSIPSSSISSSSLPSSVPSSSSSAPYGYCAYEWQEIDQVWFIQQNGCVFGGHCISDDVYDPGYPGNFNGEKIYVPCVFP